MASWDPEEKEGGNGWLVHLTFELNLISNDWKIGSTERTFGAQTNIFVNSDKSS